MVIFFNHRNLKTFSRTDLYFFLQSTDLSMKNDVGKYEHLHHIVYVCGYFYVGVCKQSYIFQNDFINTTFFMIPPRGFEAPDDQVLAFCNACVPIYFRRNCPIFKFFFVISLSILIYKHIFRSDISSRHLRFRLKILMDFLEN